MRRTYFQTYMGEDLAGYEYLETEGTLVKRIKGAQPTI